MNSGARFWLCVCMFALGALQVGQASLIYLKARLAPVLIENAWERSLEDEATGVKPWFWADTYPTARLILPDSQMQLFVLSDASGHSLAFGPGVVQGSSPVGEKGLTVIGGHRDTHFAFLKHIEQGSELLLETVDGRRIEYTVQSRRVVDAGVDTLEWDEQASLLWLVTCFPFDALLPGGNQRLVVEALRTAG